MKLFEVKKKVVGRSEDFEARQREAFIKTNAFLDALRENCLHNLEKMATGRAPVLYRGMKPARLVATDYATYGLFGRRSSPRASKTGNNMILNWVSGSPSWRHVPRRELSSSCALSNSSTYMFGQEYVVIPFDDVREYAWMPHDFNYTALGIQDGPHLGELNQNTIPRVIKSFGALASFKGKRLVGSAPSKVDLIFREIKSKAGDPVFSLNSYTLRDVAEFSELSDQVYALLSEALGDEQLVDSMPAEMRIVMKAALKSLQNLYHETKSRPLLEFLAKEVTPDALGVKVTDLVGLGEIKSLGLEDTAEVWFVGGFIYMNIEARNAVHDLGVILEAVKRGY